jgi:hypothetical protein
LKFSATNLPLNFQFHLILWHDNLNVACC